LVRRRVRVRPGPPRFLGMGRDHRRRLLRAGVTDTPSPSTSCRHRDDPERGGADPPRARLRRESSENAKRCWRRTTRRYTSRRRQAVLIGHRGGRRHPMIFSIIVVLTSGLTQNLDKLSLLHPPFCSVSSPLAPSSTGSPRRHPGGVTGRVSRGGVHQGEHSAWRRHQGVGWADSKKVVEICTQYAQ